MQVRALRQEKEELSGLLLLRRRQSIGAEQDPLAELDRVAALVSLAQRFSVAKELVSPRPGSKAAEMSKVRSPQRGGCLRLLSPLTASQVYDGGRRPFSSSPNNCSRSYATRRPPGNASRLFTRSQTDAGPQFARYTLQGSQMKEIKAYSCRPLDQVRELEVRLAQLAELLEGAAQELQAAEQKQTPVRAHPSALLTAVLLTVAHP